MQPAHPAPAGRPPLVTALYASAGVLGVLAVLIAIFATPLAAVVAIGPAVVALLASRSMDPVDGLRANELARLAAAEVALAEAASTQAAARQLGKHARVLLDAPAALVLIEGLGDTVRVAVGDVPEHAIYGPGSRMRLLDDGRAQCGSIAVAARRDGRAYDERDEGVLDALADRVSATLHRLALFEAVQFEKRRLADVVGSSSDGIFSVGPDFRVQSWNAAMETLTGITAGDAIGESCCATFRLTGEDGEPRTGATCPGRQAVHAAAAVDNLLAQCASSIRPRWVSASFSPMSDGGYMAVVRDVTARKEIDDEKADFLATVSHELRTPLTPLKGFLQTLMRRGDEFGPEERRRIYEVMVREQQRLEGLVHQLLDATSLDQVDRVARLQVVDWRAVVTGHLDALRIQEPTRAIDLVVAAFVPPVLADPVLADRVLSNLIGNALKYSPPGSPVTVTLNHRGDEVVTTVADRGPGVPVADRERVFHKFTRLGDHLTRPQQGIGLGLSIAKRSVEALGGRIEVADHPGGGAAFAFTLPVAPGAPVAPVVPVAFYEVPSSMVTDSTVTVRLGEPSSGCAEFDA